MSALAVHPQPPNSQPDLYIRLKKRPSAIISFRMSQCVQLGECMGKSLLTEISIIICTRNRAHALGPMLDALKKVQTERSWELLLIDNASTDNTRDVLDGGIADFDNARVETVTAVGLGSARDAAWRLASGKIVLFTDDDCYVAPDIVDAALQVFEKHPDIGFMGGRILLHDPDDYPVTIDERDQAIEIAPYRFAPPGTLQGANFSFRRSSLDAIGGIDTMLGAGTAFPCEDIDAVAACMWEGIAGRFDPTVVVRHHHGRKEADFPALMQSYDRGRGAYYAKYIAHPASRSAYLSEWMADTFSRLHRAKLATFWREAKSGAHYLFSSAKWLTLILWVPLTAFVWLGLGSSIIANKLLMVAQRSKGEPTC